MRGGQPLEVCLKGSQWDFLVEMQIKEGRIGCAARVWPLSLEGGNCY